MTQKTTITDIKWQKNKILTKVKIAAKKAKDSGGKPFIFHFLAAWEDWRLLTRSGGITFG